MMVPSGDGSEIKVGIPSQPSDVFVTSRNHNAAYKIGNDTEHLGMIVAHGTTGMECLANLRQTAFGLRAGIILSAKVRSMSLPPNGRWVTCHGEAHRTVVH